MQNVQETANTLFVQAAPMIAYASGEREAIGELKEEARRTVAEAVEKVTKSSLMFPQRAARQRVRLPLPRKQRASSAWLDRPSILPQTHIRRHVQLGDTGAERPWRPGVSSSDVENDHAGRVRIGALVDAGDRFH